MCESLSPRGEGKSSSPSLISSYAIAPRRYRGLWTSLRRSRHDFHLFMQDDARKRIVFAAPRRFFENRFGVGISRVPASRDARRAEIDVLGVVFAVELRCQQA